MLYVSHIDVFLYCPVKRNAELHAHKSRWNAFFGEKICNSDQPIFWSGHWIVRSLTSLFFSPLQISCKYGSLTCTEDCCLDSEEGLPHQLDHIVSPVRSPFFILHHVPGVGSLFSHYSLSFWVLHCRRLQEPNIKTGSCIHTIVLNLCQLEFSSRHIFASIGFCSWYVHCVCITERGHRLLMQCIYW